MALKPGYKQTEVGAIPEEWGVVQLVDLKPFITSGSRGWASFYSESGSLFVRITNLSRESIYLDFDDSKFVRLPPETSEGVRTQLKEHDVLISITADIGMIGYVDEHVPMPAYINQHIALVRFDSSKTCGKFVSYFLASERPQKLFRASTDTGAKAGMSLGTVQKILTAHPPLPEQYAIATALSDVDALLGALERLIVKKRDLKQAAMQQLLTGQTRLPGFHGEWEVVSMRGVLTQSATYGIVTAGVFVQNGVKMLRGGDIVDGRVNTDLPMVSRDKAVEYVRTVLEQDDVVIALVGYPGASAKIPEELVGANISRAVGLLRLNSKVVPDFVVCFLNSPEGRRMVLAPSAGSAQQVVNLAALNKLQFTIPPLPEQTAIASVLTDMDAELEALQQRLAKTRALKQGMMQELLTGRTRLL
ncbi:EcoKI restriction-modification system protein HsdS [Pseudomonas sp. 22 E 5]|jgi:type I restriction enzyme S subunit|nr:EcoKI restriction-modification system protein HsdS [Pseudomonas sp. 22 E 5]